MRDDSLPLRGKRTRYGSATVPLTAANQAERGAKAAATSTAMAKFRWKVRSRVDVGSDVKVREMKLKWKPRERATPQRVEKRAFTSVKRFSRLFSLEPNNAEQCIRATHDGAPLPTRTDAQ